MRRPDALVHALLLIPRASSSSFNNRTEPSSADRANDLRLAVSDGVSSRMARGILGGACVALGGAALAAMPYLPGIPAGYASLRRLGTESLQTHRWRGMDSKFRSPSLSVPSTFGY